MTSELSVTGTVEDGAVVLNVIYDHEHMFHPEASSKLSNMLIQEYLSKCDSRGVITNSCVVVIHADTAGSPLVRSLFELYKVVKQAGGEVICANYPPDYLAGIATLGLPDLPGFILVPDKRAALKKLASLRAAERKHERAV
jgi:hypothetical protein